MMKKYARIDAAKVAELFETDGEITEMFHPSMSWVEVTTLAIQPAEGWRYDGINFAPPEGPSLFDLKVLKNAEINSARLVANRSTFSHQNKEFACDELSRSDIDGANGMISNLGAMPPGWPGGWKAVDNTYVPIATVAEWKAFYGSMFAAGATNFAHAQALKEELAAATTPGQVAAIGW